MGQGLRVDLWEVLDQVDLCYLFCSTAFFPIMIMEYTLKVESVPYRDLTLFLKKGLSVFYPPLRVLNRISKSLNKDTKNGFILHKLKGCFIELEVHIN